MAIVWTEQQPAGNAGKYWRIFKTNADGTKFIAGAWDGRLYTYDGSSWSEHQPAGNADKDWIGGGINSDGTKFIAEVMGGRLYTYDGTSWTEQQPAGNADKNWYCSGINSDGTKFIAGIEGAGTGRLYTYDGSSWSEEQPDGDVGRNWRSCAINNDGTKFFVAGFNGHTFHYDGSWSEVVAYNNYYGDWRSCGINSDGTKFILTEDEKTYTYDGSDWTYHVSLFNLNEGHDIYNSGIDADGTQFITGFYGGRLYTYDGSSWSEQQPAGDEDKAWVVCDINSDGTKFIAGAYNGRLYTAAPQVFHYTISASLSGLVQQSGVYTSASIQAAIQSQQLKNLSADGAVAVQHDISVSADGAIQAGQNISVSPDGAVQAGHDVFVSPDGAIQAGQNISVSADGAVAAGHDVSVSPDGAIAAVKTISIAADGAVQVGGGVSLSPDAAVAASKTVSTAPDAAVSRKSEKTVTADGAVSQNQDIFITADGAVQRTGGQGFGLSGYTRRVKLTIDSSKIDSDLTHFPVPIPLGTSVGLNAADVSAIFDAVGSDFLKIAVTTADGETQLYVEVEQWDAVNEKALIWVSKSDFTVLSASDTELYLYYDADAPDNTDYVGLPGSRTDVWNSDFAAFYTMAQDPSSGAGCIKDSTANANHGTPAGSWVAGDLLDGPIGKAINFDGNDEFLNPGESLISFLSNYPSTVSCWVFFEELSGGNQYWWNPILSKSCTAGGCEQTLMVLDDGTVQFTQNSNIGNCNILTSSGVVETGSWYKLNLSMDGSYWRIFINGVLEAEVANSNFWNKPPSSSGTHIGRVFVSGFPKYEGLFKGKIAELSISSAHTSGRIAADYHAQTDNLITWGSVEIAVPTALELSAAVRGSDVKTVGADGALQGRGSINVTMDAQIGAPIAITADMDGAIQDSGAAVADMDAWVASVQSVVTGISGALQAGQGVAAEVDALVQSGAGVSVDLSAVLRQRKSLAVDIDMAIYHRTGRLYYADAALSVSPDVTTGLGARVQAVQMLDQDMDAAVAAVRDLTAGMDVQVLAHQSLSAGLDSAVMQGAARSFDADGVLQSGQVLTTGMDVRAQKTNFSTTGIGAVISPGFYQAPVFLSAGIKQRDLSLSVSMDAGVQARKQRTGSVDAALAGTVAAEISADAVVFQPGQSLPLTIDGATMRPCALPVELDSRVQAHHHLSAGLDAGVFQPGQSLQLSADVAVMRACAISLGIDSRVQAHQYLSAGLDAGMMIGGVVGVGLAGTVLAQLSHGVFMDSPVQSLDHTGFARISAGVMVPVDVFVAVDAMTRQVHGVSVDVDAAVRKPATVFAAADGVLQSGQAGSVSIGGCLVVPGDIFCNLDSTLYVRRSLAGGLDGAVQGVDHTGFARMSAGVQRFAASTTGLDSRVRRRWDISTTLDSAVLQRQQVGFLIGSAVEAGKTGFVAVDAALQMGFDLSLVLDAVCAFCYTETSDLDAVIEASAVTVCGMSGLVLGADDMGLTGHHDFVLYPPGVRTVRCGPQDKTARYGRRVGKA